MAEEIIEAKEAQRRRLEEYVKKTAHEIGIEAPRHIYITKQKFGFYDPHRKTIHVPSAEIYKEFGYSPEEIFLKQKLTAVHELCHLKTGSGHGRENPEFCSCLHNILKPEYPAEKLNEDEKTALWSVFERAQCEVESDQYLD